MTDIPPPRPISIFGTGVTDRWFKNIWLTQRGVTNPVQCFIDDAPMHFFAAGVDGISVVGSMAFFDSYSDRGRPFVFLNGFSHTEERIAVLLKSGLHLGLDFALYPNAPDYTIDWLAFYSDWQQAARDTAGYEDPTNIDSQVRAVRDARAAPVPATINYADQRLFTPLGVVFSKISGLLRVVDFGGALGGHYIRVKRFFPHRPLDWWVSETSAMAQAGNDTVATEDLHFVDDPSKVPSNVDLVLASGSLHCVPDSVHYFKELRELNPRFFLFDRIPLSPWSEDRVMVQRVFRNSKDCFETSYPARFLSDARWTERFGEHFTTVMRWQDTHDIVEIGGQRIVFSGLLLERK